MTESQTEEKLAQEEYEEMMKDSAAKRASDTKSLAEKRLVLADSENLIVSKDEELTSTKKNIMATTEYLGQLHAQCDWLLKYFDMRTAARNTEIDSLQKARAVLSGADFSLVQTK